VRPHRPASAHPIQHLPPAQTSAPTFRPSHALLHPVLQCCRPVTAKLQRATQSPMADQQPGGPTSSGGGNGGNTGVGGGSGGGGGGLFQCGDCGRSYTRADHLARHVRSRKFSSLFPEISARPSLIHYRYRYARKAFSVYYLSQAVFTRVRCVLIYAALGAVDTSPFFSDLLKRHFLNHDENNDSKRQRRARSLTAPGRVTQACKACATAKLRCEEEKPCHRCEQKGMKCEYVLLEAVRKLPKGTKRGTSDLSCSMGWLRYS